MKKLISIVVLLSAISCIVACKEDVPTMYNQADGIYFNSSADSLYYTFAKHPSRMVDTIKVPVNVLGNAATTDREITVDVVAGSGTNAVEGTHYKLLRPYKMPANSYSTLLPIVVYRTADLDSVQVGLSLKLSPNQNFT